MRIILSAGLRKKKKNWRRKPKRSCQELVNFDDFSPSVCLSSKRASGVQVEWPHLHCALCFFRDHFFLSFFFFFFFFLLRSRSWPSSIVCCLASKMHHKSWKSAAAATFGRANTARWKEEEEAQKKLALRSGQSRALHLKRAAEKCTHFPIRLALKLSQSNKLVSCRLHSVHSSCTCWLPVDSKYWQVEKLRPTQTQTQTGR